MPEFVAWPTSKQACHNDSQAIFTFNGFEKNGNSGLMTVLPPYTDNQ
jgi:hypothetical protein